jgi:hypothetical protein
MADKCISHRRFARLCKDGFQQRSGACDGNSFFFHLVPGCQKDPRGPYEETVLFNMNTGQPQACDVSLIVERDNR